MFNNHQDLIITLFGASGVGKTALQHFLQKRFNALPMITHTTRKPRSNEKKGVDYHFNTVDQFKKLDLMEYTKYDNNYYGSAKNDIDKAWKNGHHLLSIVLDYKGISAYIKKLHKHVVPIYLFTNTQTLVKRLTHRGMPQSDIKARLLEHQHDLNHIYNVVFNSGLTVYRVDTTNWKLETKTTAKIIKHPNLNYKL